MIQKLAKTNQSVEKVFHIIEIMAQNREPMRLQDIAAEAEMPTSTALRMVNTLLSAGYVNQDGISLRYSLSLKFAQIASLINPQISIRDLGRPLMTELSLKCSESCCLAIEENMEIVYIDVVDGPDSMLKIMHRIGKRAPMYCTGVGKLMLTNYDSESLDEFFSAVELRSFTPNTITAREDLIKELGIIRQRGYSLDNEECELGVRCVAAGIRDYSGKIVAAISVAGPISRITPERTEIISPIVMEYALRMSKFLAYKP